MKIISHFLKIFTSICIILVLPCTVYPVTYQTDFTQELEDEWQLLGSDSIWHIEEGFLRTEIKTQKQWQTIFELYQFIEIQGPYHNLTIRAEDIGADELRFGIALGKHFLNDQGEIEETGYYLFFTNDMQTARDRNVFPSPGKRWGTDALALMELHFDTGRFQLIGDGESRMDFRDENLLYLDIIGFVLIGYVTDMKSTGEGWVNKITISGLPVTPKRKLTTIWGHLKK
ncbi:hypothetical protein C6497_13145 [Candidatus Poribacteria bacterium]|nr:MAG: hypothetical protein C6497_13145 [Candidatus Poribacteria bacterium]